MVSGMGALCCAEGCVQFLKLNGDVRVCRPVVCIVTWGEPL
jgi:hypothetical protein